jgi:DNA (cytosine-5)-methyltransferase 1
MRFTAIDMFCGAGGASKGAMLAGAHIVQGIDAWSVAAKTYGDNFRETVVETRTLGPYSLPSRMFSRGDIDLLLASPECTNHSHAKGAKPRCEKSQRTSNYVVNFARRLMPRWIVLENVVELRFWQGFDGLIRQLRNVGYHVRLEVLDAAEFGVPQTRRRLYVLCDRDHEPASVDYRNCTKRTAAEVVQLGGPWSSKPLKNPGRAKATIERAERAMAVLGKRIPFLIVYYGSDKGGVGGWQSLDRPIRTLTTLDRFGLVTWEGMEPMLRMLQVDELRSAMGFPDNHQFRYGSRRDKIMMIGNAVCPPVMQAIITSLTKAQ